MLGASSARCNGIASLASFNKLSAPKAIMKSEPTVQKAAGQRGKSWPWRRGTDFCVARGPGPGARSEDETRSCAVSRAGRLGLYYPSEVPTWPLPDLSTPVLDPLPCLIRRLPFLLPASSLVQAARSYLHFLSPRSLFGFGQSPATSAAQTVVKLF
jgi:hypothetical protein